MEEFLMIIKSIETELDCSFMFSCYHFLNKIVKIIRKKQKIEPYYVSDLISF